MQRRQLLKLALPITLLSVGMAGLALRQWRAKSNCVAADLATVLRRLKPFADAELGKSAGIAVSTEALQGLESICGQDFDQQYRQLVQDDFAAGRTEDVDGWMLSHTEALTHHVVYGH